MKNTERIYQEIKRQLEVKAPKLTQDQKSRMYRILNSSNPNFESYGLKLSEIEKLIRDIEKEQDCTYDEAIEIFKILMKSNIHDEKFAGIFFLNRYFIIFSRR
ncbi:MAG: DNA alkylation repair protein [Candidatus Helarchaeota archaeon]|nr:DNA alkylation repair protein [Candidatus Helarchaeota archaeon]